jgi:hypothetical protein
MLISNVNVAYVDIARRSGQGMTQEIEFGQFNGKIRQDQ